MQGLWPYWMTLFERDVVKDMVLWLVGTSVTSMCYYSILFHYTWKARNGTNLSYTWLETRGSIITLSVDYLCKGIIFSHKQIWEQTMNTGNQGMQESSYNFQCVCCWWLIPVFSKVLELLEVYERAFGQKVNTGKLFIFFSSNMTQYNR